VGVIESGIETAGNKRKRRNGMEEANEMMNEIDGGGGGEAVSQDNPRYNDYIDAYNKSGQGKHPDPGADIADEPTHEAHKPTAPKPKLR
jgi:hypothetical protein